jgi:hypothetical protein
MVAAPAALSVAFTLRLAITAAVELASRPTRAVEPHRVAVPKTPWLQRGAIWLAAAGDGGAADGEAERRRRCRAPSRPQRAAAMPHPRSAAGVRGVTCVRPRRRPARRPVFASTAP